MIYVNGEPRPAQAGLTVSALLDSLELDAPDGRGIAVAVDSEIVPRTRWATTPIPDEARIEVVHAVQGG